MPFALPALLSLLLLLVSARGQDPAYGKNKVQVRSAGDLFEAFRAVTGARLEEVGEFWLRETRSIYWPELAKRRTPLVLARQLTDHEEEDASFNAQPALPSDGGRIAFESDRTRPIMPWNPEDPFAGRKSLSRYSDIYAIPSGGGEARNYWSAGAVL